MESKIIKGNLWTAKKIESTYIVSLEDGSSIVRTLADFIAGQKISNAKIKGIGKVNKVSLRFFDPSKWESFDETFDKTMGIFNIVGNVYRTEGKSLLDLHITLEKDNYINLAGQVSDAEISGKNKFFFYPFNTEEIDFKQEDI